MTPEHAADDLLLRATQASPAEVFPDGADLDTAKAGADLLVSAKLAKFADDGRTQLAPTNAGRYWALHGGYLAFLKEEPIGGGGGGRGRNPELEEARLTLMRLRLNTFWWSFGISIAGFVISIVSLAVAFSLGGRLVGP
jgi:hypothetical protein